MSISEVRSPAGKISEQDVMQLIAEALELPVSAVRLQTRAADLPEWDSMGVLSILSVLDREGIKCEIGNADALQSVAGVLEMVREAGKLA